MRYGLAFIHPLLFAAAPIVLLAAANVEQIADLGIVLTLGAISMASAAILVLVTWSAMRDFERAALLVSMAVIAFFAYGHLFEFVKTQQLLESGRQIHWYLGINLAVIGSIAITLLSERKKKLSRVTNCFFAVSTILLAFGTIQLVQGFATAPLLAGQSVVPLRSSRPPDVPPPRTEESSKLPDIYYIILDGYVRKDVLADRFQFDNTEFLTSLEEKEFYVAEKSCSNYPLTFLSLASSLNMRHVMTDADSIGRDQNTRRRMYSLIYDNRVARFLQSRGYRYLLINSNWAGTERSDIADVEYRALGSLLQKEFTALLVRTTMLRQLTPGVADIHRFALAKLKEIPRLEGPTFTFCHLLLPHNPYVFDRQGNVSEDIPLWLQFERKTGGWQNRDGYVEQLRFLNREVIEIVTQIIAQSEVPPVIILQADHGSATLDDGTLPAENMGLIRERLPILNAYYVPECCRKNLYRHVTPVNTFRILFNSLFDAEFVLLEDRQYISWYRRPYDLADCTSVFETERKTGNARSKSSE